MTAEEKQAAGNTRMLVLALGLILGFFICFILLLSRLPIDSTFDDPFLGMNEDAEQDFQFYNLLREQTTSGRVVAEVANNQRIVPVGTRTVPGHAQQLNSRAQAAENYAEIPASSIGQESYYLQAGNFVSPDDAERARLAVGMLGLDAFVVKRSINGRVGHRVRVGPFFDRQRLSDAKQRLRRGNIGYEIIRVAGFRDAERARN